MTERIPLPGAEAGEMYAFLESAASGLEQTRRALPFAREKHAGLLRRGPQKEPYIVHPLTMACHAWAAGLREDDVLSALLLHDTVEDCGVTPEELPAGEAVRRAVRLVSHNTYTGTKREILPVYYSFIRTDALACLVKCVDRCHNLSVMARAFSREHMAEYVEETKRYILPLIPRICQMRPEWSGAAWLLDHHLQAVTETVQRLV